MQLRILARDFDLPPAERRAIERTVRLVVGRHAAGVASLQVTLARNGSDSGAASHRCRIHVDLWRGGDLTVADDAADPSAAAAGAAWRIERRLRQRSAPP